MRKDTEQIVSHTNVVQISTVLFKALIIFQVLLEIGTLSLDILSNFHLKW